MKNILILGFLAIFIIGFVSVASASITGSVITGSAVNDNGNQAQQNKNNSEQNEVETQLQNVGTETQIRLREKIKESNRLRIHVQNGECPNNCTCSGSTTKCQTQSGREITISAGNSGNTIFQVKGQDASTNVKLYKDENGKVLGVFRNNNTKEILLPDQIQERIRQRLQIQNCSCGEMILDEDGIYRVQAKKRARFLGLFPLTEKVKFEVDAETGEIIKVRNSWWGFLAKDIDEDSSSDEE